MSTQTRSNHIGRKISRLRELKDMKQEALAQALGISQQTVSAIENSETVDEEKLIEIAKVLGLSVEAIKNFSEEAVFTFFNNFYDNSNQGASFGNYNTCNFNPLDKLMESLEQNKSLYERLLESEREKISYLEKLLNSK
ncbi:XRE family transcriptional regulator [Flavobacterium sp. WLB]|uniref:helix-turn-helix transcriptional regulator n=1 Tax=unclassified Flavobacterium TaxID=196869 RepID=UPI0006ABC14B|nr:MULTISPECIES: helix-turn-helix transcriptional regulator [unclassified Flavobacterium]KOP38063.1 transcriptional regulator [Flavobacterium sp. VMW]OWU89070.1 transcriptional regulator [Flavobacterium sp. NLM]PUU67646.1 XRE family transcriptional regulator [Flavobacterium sp. WLB]